MIQGGQRFFQGGQSGMNSLLAPGLHPFSPHFSPQKSGKPETVSVNLWMRKTEKILSVDTFWETSCLGDDLSGLLSDPSAHYGRWRQELVGPGAGIKHGCNSLIALLSTFLKESANSQLSPPSKKQRQGLSDKAKIVHLQSMPCTFEDTHHSRLNRPSL